MSREETRLRIESLKKKIAELEHERNVWLRNVWNAGERDVAELALYTGLEPDAVIRRLQEWGIDVEADHKALP